MKQVVERWPPGVPGRGDIALDGRHVCVTSLPKPPGQSMCAFVALSPVDARLAVAASDGRVDTAFELVDGAWVSRGLSCGLNAVMYDTAGSLFVSHCEADVGSQGWTAATGIGRGGLVTADSSCADHARRIWNYLEFGAFAIGQGDDDQDGGGVVVKFQDEAFRRRVTFQALAASGPIRDLRGRSDGVSFALAATDYRGLTTFTWGSVAELRAMAPITVSMAAIGRACWLGWFAFGSSQDAPRNAELLVATAPARMYVRDGHGQKVAQYVAGNPDSDLAAVDRAIADGKAADPTVPVLAYWTRRAQATRPPVAAEYVGVEAYAGLDETDAAFEARLRKAVGQVKSAWLIAQCYSSNANNTKDLTRIPPVVARVARNCSNVRGILVFSAGTRATGWSEHPEVHDLWRQVLAGIHGTPAIETVQTEEFVEPFKIDFEHYDPAIQKGKDFAARCGIGNGLEVEFEKDADDVIHFAVYRDGVRQDRSGAKRYVDVKG